ncbi:putative polysaccharide biosynthesis protein [Arthrobacter globiformis NBRC 12137]|uniref:Putative polysaccharide biosynthesis protein n=2 Tax=Arthrobacter globiformis TaxID=1665 RepID=H0QND8_ARTG1|nr:putative polysaccharide biosynthesis protein [Arthrobacter globiformis NBRC 12137]
MTVSESRRSRRQKKQRGLFTQTLMLAAGTGLGQVIVAVMYIWTARSVGPEELGPTVAAIGIGTTLAGFLDFGSNNLWVRESAASRMNSRTLGHRLTAKLAVGFLALSCWCFGLQAFAPESMLWIAGPIGWSVLVSQSFAVPLRAAARLDLVAISMLTDRVVAGGVFVIFNMLSLSTVFALWGSLTIGPIAASVMSRWVLGRTLRPRLRLSFRTNPWNKSGYYGLSSAAVSAQSLDLSIMSMVGGPAAAGLYGAVNRWTQPMSLLAGAFTTSAAPLVARHDSWAAAWPHLRRSASLVLVAVFMCVSVAIFADPIVGLLVGAEYRGSGNILRILALGTIGAVLNQPLAAFLQALGRDRAVSVITMTGVAVQLLLVAFLTWQAGAAGAALAYCVLQLVILMLLAIMIRGTRTPRIIIGRHSSRAAIR